jgi:hypothetical protein
MKSTANRANLRADLKARRQTKLEPTWANTGMTTSPREINGGLCGNQQQRYLLKRLTITVAR